MLLITKSAGVNIGDRKSHEGKWEVEGGNKFGCPELSPALEDRLVVVTSRQAIFGCHFGCHFQEAEPTIEDVVEPHFFLIDLLL